MRQLLTLAEQHRIATAANGPREQPAQLGTGSDLFALARMTG